MLPVSASRLKRRTGGHAMDYDLSVSKEMCVACSARGRFADSAGIAIPWLTRITRTFVVDTVVDTKSRACDVVFAC